MGGGGVWEDICINLAVEVIILKYSIGAFPYWWHRSSSKLFLVLSGVGRITQLLLHVLVAAKSLPRCTGKATPRSMHPSELWPRKRFVCFLCAVSSSHKLVLLAYKISTAGGEWGCGWGSLPLLLFFKLAPWGGWTTWPVLMFCEFPYRPPRPAHVHDQRERRRERDREIKAKNT